MITFDKILRWIGAIPVRDDEEVMPEEMSDVSSQIVVESPPEGQAGMSERKALPDELPASLKMLEVSVRELSGEIRSLATLVRAYLAQAQPIGTSQRQEYQFQVARLIMSAASGATEIFPRLDRSTQEFRGSREVGQQMDALLRELRNQPLADAQAENRPLDAVTAANKE